MKKANDRKTYRVFVAQINQTMVEVKAADKDEARTKGYAKWKRDYAHSHVCAIEEKEAGR